MSTTMAHQTRYRIGPYRARITGKHQGIFGPVNPALHISVANGKGLFDYSDVHFSQAKTVRTLKQRLKRFAALACHEVKQQ